MTAHGTACRHAVPRQVPDPLRLDVVSPARTSGSIVMTDYWAWRVATAAAADAVIAAAGVRAAASHAGQSPHTGAQRRPSMAAS